MLRLLLLFFFLLPLKSKAQDWEIRENCDVSAESAKTLKKIPREDCKKACENQDNCKGFVYISAWQRCLLQKDMKKAAKLQFISADLGAQHSFDPSQLRIDHDNSGKDLERKVLDTPEECGKACEARADCASITYLAGYRVCWLKAKGGKMEEKIFSCGIRK